MIPVEDLLDWSDANPFQPFRLFLTDGQTFEITDPALIWPGRQSVMIGFSNANDHIRDRHITVALAHVVSIEPVTASPSSNA